MRKHLCAQVSRSNQSYFSQRFLTEQQWSCQNSSYFSKRLLGAAAGIGLARTAESPLIFTETIEQLSQSYNIHSLLASAWPNTRSLEVEDIHSPLPSLLSHAAPSCHWS